MPPHRLCPVKNTAFDGHSGKHSTIYFPCTCKREHTWTCMQTYNIERYWGFFKTLISFWKYYYRFHRATLSNLKIYHEFLHFHVLWTAQDGSWAARTAAYYFSVFRDIKANTKETVSGGHPYGQRRFSSIFIFHIHILFESSIHEPSSRLNQ